MSTTRAWTGTSAVAITSSFAGSTDNYNQILTTAPARRTPPASERATTIPIHASWPRVKPTSSRPHIVNDARFGYTRDYYSYLNPDNSIAIDTQLGIPNGNRSALLGGHLAYWRQQ